ncbi:MAG TPA: DUF1186 domain-containing protein [Xanthobacteraceae bacterium]|nr:DUF1186 domain-containing protein [Xanthobacteraceae bacterium]
MDAAQILNRLVYQEPLPVEALRAASADRARLAPIFVNAIEQYVSPDGDRAARDSLFFIFHLLGEWREKSAYRPLARLLRRPPDDLDEILGGAITETPHRVMAAVFDGDPEPLYEVILDPEADEYIRSCMLETIAMATLNGEMPRAEAARFLWTCYDEIKPQEECWVWQGWQSAIALLGLVELRPLVEQAFARDLISNTWLGFHHFEQDLQQAIDNPTALPRQSGGEYSLFGDTVEELSRWYCFRPEEPVKKREDIRQETVLWQRGTMVNPQRKIGRNDPCPCGSGRKFKKCCLTADVGLAALLAM